MTMLMRGSRTRSGFTTAGGGGGGGSYGYLAPNVTLPTGLTYNSSTGLIDGYTVDHSEPTWGTTVTATSGSDLQSKLDSYATSATNNTLILVTAGVTYDMTMVLPANTSGYWIGVKTTGHASLPTVTSNGSVGTSTNRIGTGNYSNMPEIRVPGNGSEACITRSGAKKYWLRGIRFTNPNLYSVSGLGMIGVLPRTSGGSDEFTTDASYPEDIIFVQCNVDGGGNGYAKRAWYCSARRFAIVDSYVDHMGITSTDSQFIFIRSGQGPFKINNNYGQIGGDSEWMIVGGDALPGSDATWLPTHIEVRGNVSRKNAYGNHKNHFELKYGKYVLFEGNNAADHNGLGQSSGTFVIKLSDQGGSNTADETAHVCIRYNTATHAYAGLALSGPEFYSGSNVPDHIDCYGNLFVSSGTHGSLIQGPFTDGWFRYNTQIADGYKLNINDTSGAATRCTIENNVIVGGQYGTDYVIVMGGGTHSGTQGQTAFTYFSSSGTLRKNMVIPASSATDYPNDIRVANTTAGSFTNYAGGDYSLTSGSPGHNTSSDGVDVGVPFSLFNTIQAGVL